LAEVLKYDHEHEAAIGLARTLANSADTAQAALQLLASTLEHLKANDKIYDLALFLAERSDSDREAIRCYRAACNAYPRGRRALRGLFERYRNVGDVERAEDVANRLFKLLEPGDPSALEIRFNLAQALAQTQETIPHAMAHARTVLEARPNDLHALRLNVDLLERIGRPVEAANLLDRWVARAAERSEQHAITLRKATLLEAAGELDRALEAAKHALALSPNHAVGVALTVSLLQKTGADEEVGAYLPSARAALVDRINRGEVIDEDFALLSIVAKANDRDLGTIAEILLQIILASDLAQLPEPHPATAAALDGLLETPALRASLYSAAEPQQLHQLLRTIDGPLGKLLGEFPALDPERATAAILNRGDMNPVRAYARAIAFVAGVENLKLEMAEPEHTAFLQGNPPLLRLGRNVWEQGDMLTWRGMIAVAAARLAMGSARTRTLPPGEFDLILAACFDAVGVFNPMAADPDPNRRRSLAMQLAGQWDQQTRDEVENLCKSMANYAFDPGRTTLALWSTDLRLACLLSGDLAGCLAAAAFVDGGAGSTLKKRIENSAMARELLAYLTSSEFVIARRALQ
jgi:tetratricopeptide (TPR) repeat protein